MKKFLVVSIVLLIILMGGFLLINSGVFVKQVVFPIVASSLDTDITVDDVDFSIFKGIQLVNFTVEADGGQPSPLNADVVRVRYRFMPLLKGKVQVDEVLLENVSVHVTEDKNGVLNIPGGAASEPSSTKPRMEKKEEAIVVPQFDIRNVTIKNLSLSYEREARDESPKTLVTVSRVTFSLDTLAPGEAFQINSHCSLSCTIDGQLNASVKQCKLGINGMIREDCFPGSLNLAFSMEGISGKAGPVTLDDRVVRFDVGCEGDGVNYQVKRCEFSEAFKGNIEGHGAVKGDIKVDPFAANLALEMKTVGPGFLNLVGGLIGDYNFGDTEIRYTSDLQVTDNASSITAVGDLEVTNFSVSSESLGISGLRPVNSSFTHNITYEQEQQLIDLRKLNMLVTDDERELVTLVLSQPTAISFKQTAGSQHAEATVNLTVKDFNLEFFKPLIPQSTGIELRQGILNKGAELKIYGGGERLELNGTTTISDFNVNAARHDYSGLGLEKHYTVKANDFFSELVVERLKTTGLVNGKVVFDMNALASVDLTNMIGTTKIAPITVTPEMKSLIPEELLTGYDITNINSDGNFEITLEKNNKIKIDGSIKSDNIIVQDTKKNSELSLSSNFDLKAVYTADGNLRINTCSLNLGSPKKAPCKIDLTGRLNSRSLEGDLALDVKDIAAPLLEVSSRFLGMDLYFGSTRFGSTLALEIGNKGNDLAFKGEFTGDDITVESNQLGLQALRPLNLSVLYGGKFLIDSNAINMDKLLFYVDDQNARVISAELEEPATMKVMPQASSSTSAPAVINFDIDELHLDLVEPLIPEGMNLDVSNGRLNTKMNISITDLISQVLCVGSIELGQVTIPPKPDVEEQIDTTLFTQIEFDIGYSSDGMIRIDKCTSSLNEKGEPLVRMAVKGDLDATMSGKPSTLSITSLVPIQAKRLQEISEGLTKADNNNDQSEEGVDESSTAPSKSAVGNEKDEAEVADDHSEIDSVEPVQSEMPKLDGELNVDIPEVHYDQVIISGFKPTIQIRNDNATIDPFTFRVNEGSARLGISCDYTDSSAPLSAGEIELNHIDLQPIAKSVTPEYGHYASGTLKNVNSSFETIGASFDDILKSLKANASCELININLAQSLENYSAVITLLSGGIVKASDLVFDVVRIEGTMVDSVLDLADLSFHNPNLRILSNGELKFDGHWVGEVGLTPGYAGELAKLAEKNNLSLEKGEDDYYYTDKIPLKIDTSKNAKTLIKEWLPSLADKLIDLDELGPEGKAIKDGVKSLGGILSGKQSVKEALKGGVDIFDSLRKGKQEKGNSEEGKEEIESESQEGSGEKKDDIKDLLKNLW